MTTPSVTPEQSDLYRQRAWRAYDLAADEERDGPEWDQAYYRHRCGTACCYAGLLVMSNDRPWLLDYNDAGLPIIDGTPVSDDHVYDEYLVAAPGDPEHAITEQHGKQVIHVKYVAAMLIGLDPYGFHADDGGLFAPQNTLDDLKWLITKQIGPRPAGQTHPS
ncbi:hypothetical protein [Nonomuraea sp. NPDC049141]|uniref:hypothetical protein n=1 Tax=Nonomuraea sp. NPDC049141 TaxID=3155500 RepID=UPI0033D1E79F